MFVAPSAVAITASVSVFAFVIPATVSISCPVLAIANSAEGLLKYLYPEYFVSVLCPFAVVLALRSSLIASSISPVSRLHVASVYAKFG